MALTKYREKRNFKETPEPTGGKPQEERLRFVIQKHDATRLHYDLRLEMEGVLKSWAVPKGPSTDASVKRLAMMVEDHPFDYRSFEGIIPSGYGAGTVIVWDEGYYEAAGSEGKDKRTQDKELLKGLRAGKLHVILHGKKVKGEYGLVRTKGMEQNAWLLFKVKDDHVSKEDITLKDKSVISKKTLEQVEKTSTVIYGQKPARGAAKKEVKSIAVKKRSTAKPAAERKGKEVKKKAPAGPAGVNKGTRVKLPVKLSPMLATLVDKPFDAEGWVYEVKWDGYRTIAFCNKDEVEMRSRNDKSFNEKFYPVTDALRKLKLQAVLDGEVVVLDEKGQSNFGALQNWRSEADGELFFYVFDLLWLNGRSLMELPLMERKEVLSGIIKGDGIIRLSESFAVSGTEFYEAAEKMGLEGIIAKRAESLYTPGIRTREWLKIKANKRQEMVIGGFTRNDDTSKTFSSLLVGVYDDKKLVYTGKVGTGFNDKQQKEMIQQFKKLVVKSPPFMEVPDVNKPSRFRPNPPNATVTWLKPELVCEVSFTEMTTDGIMRHPSFEGMRMDKKAKEVVLEKPVQTAKTPKTAKTAVQLLKPTGEGLRKTLLNPTDESQVRVVKGHELKFNNLSKIYWPGEGITKRDLINYYYQVAPYILPYLKDRPQSMNRFPNGITGESFYQKDVTGKAPEWIKTYLYHSEADDRDRHYLVATNEASLLYMASLGCIEMNPWSSRVDKPDNPDWCVIDIDPAENTFNQVIEAAQVTKKLLDSVECPCYAKTSGSTGIHIYIPLGAKYSYDESKEFARIIATLVHRELPKFTSIERIVKKRKGKMYIDFLQNRPQATLSSAYSVRPKPGATVSMPLHWEEVKKGMKMKDFNIRNTVDRLKDEGDIFKPVLGKGINLKTILSNLKKLENDQ